MPLHIGIGTVVISAGRAWYDTCGEAIALVSIGLDIGQWALDESRSLCIYDDESLFAVGGISVDIGDEPIDFSNSDRIGVS